MEPFKGIVQLKEWWAWHNGKSYRAIAGLVSVVRDEDIVGFKAQSHESNYVIKVAGDTETVYILGCQYRGVVKVDIDVTALDDTVMELP